MSESSHPYYVTNNRPIPTHSRDETTHVVYLRPNTDTDPEVPSTCKTLFVINETDDRWFKIPQPTNIEKLVFVRDTLPHVKETMERYDGPPFNVLELGPEASTVDHRSQSQYSYEFFNACHRLFHQKALNLSLANPQLLFELSDSTTPDKKNRLILWLDGYNQPRLPSKPILNRAAALWKQLFLRGPIESLGFAWVPTEPLQLESLILHITNDDDIAAVPDEKNPFHLIWKTQSGDIQLYMQPRDDLVRLLLQTDKQQPPIADTEKKPVVVVKFCTVVGVDVLHPTLTILTSLSQAQNMRLQYFKGCDIPINERSPMPSRDDAAEHPQ